MVSRASVIVTELDLEGIAIDEPEADSPLVVDGDSILPVAIAAQGVQSIATGGAEVGEPRCRINRIELPLRPPQQVWWDPPGDACLEQGLGPLIGEGPDHWRL